MIRDTWIIYVPVPQDDLIIVVKVRKGTVRGNWDAQRVINALRKSLPIEKIGVEVVVMDGEPIEEPGLFGTSPHSEAHVRSILAKVAVFRWSLTKLDW